MISEYTLEDTRRYNALRTLGLVFGAVVLVAAIGLALIQKMRPW
jgi:uncharacterized membrane protein required for colicin V production